MKPFFFGTGERRLFGIYEPPAAGSAGRRAAIFCYPWGAEYLHAHRIIRQLALMLSGIGFHTLRFDFYGTGDSGGEPTDIDLVGLEADLEMAIEELAEITGLAKVTLIGLRLGATVATRVASRLHGEIEALVLWDPVLSGIEYLDQLGITANAKPPLEVQGFPLTERLRRELDALDPNALTAKCHRRTLMVVTERLSSHRTLALSMAERDINGLSIDFLTDARPWLEESILFGTVPRSVLRRISNWLE